MTIAIVFDEKTKITGCKDKYGIPLRYGDKVIAIETGGKTYKSYFIGTTPSGYSDKVLHISSVYPSRPYRGVLRYEWTAKDPQEAKDDSRAIERIIHNKPSEL